MHALIVRRSGARALPQTSTTAPSASAPRATSVPDAPHGVRSRQIAAPALARRAHTVQATCRQSLCGVRRGARKRIAARLVARAMVAPSVELRSARLPCAALHHHLHLRTSSDAYRRLHRLHHLPRLGWCRHRPAHLRRHRRRSERTCLSPCPTRPCRCIRNCFPSSRL